MNEKSAFSNRSTADGLGLSAEERFELEDDEDADEGVDNFVSLYATNICDR